MTITGKRPASGSVIHMQRSSIRATRQAQGALHKGEWIDAEAHLETALKYAGLCQDQERNAEGLA